MTRLALPEELTRLALPEELIRILLLTVVELCDLPLTPCLRRRAHKLFDRSRIYVLLVECLAVLEVAATRSAAQRSAAQRSAALRTSAPKTLRMELAARPGLLGLGERVRRSSSRARRGRRVHPEGACADRSILLDELRGGHSVVQRAGGGGNGRRH